MKASAPVEDVSDAALGEGPADVDAATTGGTVVDVLVPQVVVVVVLDGAVVLVVDGSVELVVSTTCVGTVVVVVLVVVVLVELVVLVEVDVDVLEVDVLVVVLAEHGAVVVVVDGTVEVVVLDGVVVVVVEVVTVAKAVGAVVQHEVTAGTGAVESAARTGDPELAVVAAVARLPADRAAERTTDPKRTSTNRTDQPGIRQSFLLQRPHRRGWRQLSAQTFAIATRDGMPEQMAGMLRNGERFATFVWWTRYVGGPTVPVEVPGVLGRSGEPCPGRRNDQRRTNMNVSHKNFISMSC